MIGKRTVAVRAGAWLAVAFVPLCVVACQDQGRPDSSPNANSSPNAMGGPSNEKVTEPSTAKLDDTAKTNILLRQLHAANQEEIDLGKIAEDKAQNPDVKKFASDMVQEHTAGDQKLVDLAKRLNVDINASPTDPVQKVLSSASDECKRSLKGQSGAQFDVAYFAPQVEKHTFALKLVEEAQKTASGDVKQLLDDVHSTVLSHLDHAKTVMRELTFSSAVGGGPMGRDFDLKTNAPGVGTKHGHGSRDAAPSAGTNTPPSGSE